MKQLYGTGDTMALREKADATELDRVRLQEITDAADRAGRDIFLGLPHPGYPVDQLGGNVHFFGVAPRCLLLAAAAGAPKERLVNAVMLLHGLVDSLYPPDDGMCWRAASIASEAADHAFDFWQTSTGPDASEFEIRRGIELALGVIAKHEQVVNAGRAELARRCADRHQARRRLRSTVAR